MANDATTAEAAPRTEQERLRAIRLIAVSGLIGTTIEWYGRGLFHGNDALGRGWRLRRCA